MGKGWKVIYVAILPGNMTLYVAILYFALHMLHCFFNPSLSYSLTFFLSIFLLILSNFHSYPLLQYYLSLSYFVSVSVSLSVTLSMSLSLSLSHYISLNTFLALMLSLLSLFSQCNMMQWPTFNRCSSNRQSGPKKWHDPVTHPQ